MSACAFAGKPFTAVVVETDYDEALVHPQISVTHTAVRSDGSVYSKHTASTGLTFGAIWDRGLGRQTRFFPDARAKVSTDIESYQPLPHTQCSPEMLEGPERGEVLGYRVVEYRDKDKLSEIRIWVAPDLGCFPLYTEKRLLDSDVRAKPFSVSRVSVLVEGEPDPSLFEVPSNYVEMPEDEARLKAIKNMGPRILP
jgi:hypothetical protein